MRGAACVDRIVPSPNFRERLPEDVVRYVIIHGTWMDDEAATLKRLCDPVVEVSSHYFIAMDGEIVQLVSESHVAWHAGKSRWGADEMLNGCSLGIELANSGPFAGKVATAENEAQVTDEMWANAAPYTDAQYQSLIRLLRDIMARHPKVTSACVLGHDDVSPGRKTDPGRHFDWQRLASAEVALPLPHLPA